MASSHEKDASRSTNFPTNCSTTMACTDGCRINLHAQTPEMRQNILDKLQGTPPYISGKSISYCHDGEGPCHFGPRYSPRILTVIRGPPMQQLITVRPPPEALEADAVFALSIMHCGRGNEVCVTVDDEYPGSEIVVRRGKWVMIPMAPRAVGETVEVRLYDTSDGGWDAYVDSIDEPFMSLRSRGKEL
ncbi:hypothetical protein BCR44DRAFT_1287967 [Catenaria anguillulae PL171]|uniref:Uncharacterized protein n=1 Tax=Catenaria anguillulae PL171 TaxID=765915 RepID=A0A1Y2HA17_9FUNG|nr:hypothetical protein BCR44DRAFT_1287967 [Catenaria anguillulae PL171]